MVPKQRSGDTATGLWWRGATFHESSHFRLLRVVQSLCRGPLELPVKAASSADRCLNTRSNCLIRKWVRLAVFYLCPWELWCLDSVYSSSLLILGQSFSMVLPDHGLHALTVESGPHWSTQIVVYTCPITVNKKKFWKTKKNHKCLQIVVECGSIIFLLIFHGIEN